MDEHVTEQPSTADLPVPTQGPTAPAPKLASEEIVISAPLSFHGSAARIWRPLSSSGKAAEKDIVGTAWYVLAFVLIALAWCVVLGWYGVFGLLVVPYRLIRRGQRKRKLEEARHRELLVGLDSATAGDAGVPPR